MFEWLFGGENLKCSKLQVGGYVVKVVILVILVKIEMVRALASSLADSWFDMGYL